MLRYMLLTRLSSDQLSTGRNRRGAGEAWKQSVETQCRGLRWIDHYAVSGEYDFVDVFEVPEESMAFRVSLISRTHGAESAVLWRATPYRDYLEATEDIEAHDLVPETA